MKKRESIVDYYYESMYPELKVLEQDRLIIVSKLKKAAFFLFGLAIIIYFLLHYHFYMMPFEALALSGMSTFMLFMFIYRHESAGYSMLFKDHVIEKIIHFLDHSLMYHKHRYLLENVYQKSELFLEQYDRYSGSDLVEGFIEGVGVQFCDLHVEKKYRTKNGKEEWKDIFSGLFFVADFNKHFQTNVVVLSDHSERILGVVGSWLQSMNIGRGKLIKLDDALFEKYFVVYGEDPIESRYILTHSLMEKIVQLRQKSGKNLYLSFVDSKIYIAIEYNKALFEPILWKSLLKFSYIKEYVELLSMMIGIVKHFKLDEKLWSKR